MNKNTLYQELSAELGKRLQILPDKPEENVENTLAALWQTAAGRPVSAPMATTLELPMLSAGQQERLRALLARRMAGVPLAHLTGRQQFMGIELIAGSGALIPRRETEILGHATVGLLQDMKTAGKPLRVMDVCTGAGNIAIALALNCASCRVYGADLAEEAVRLARRNAELHQVSKRVSFHVGDLFAPFEHHAFLGTMDLITCNPPYISTSRLEQMQVEIASYEPALAFDGGAFGITILHRFLQEAPRFLRPDGWLALEVGQGQGRAICRRMEKKYGFRHITPHCDKQGAIRCITACNRA